MEAFCVMVLSDMSNGGDDGRKKDINLSVISVVVVVILSVSLSIDVALVSVVKGLMKRLTKIKVQGVIVIVAVENATERH
jgi:hypothetical protein